MAIAGDCSLPGLGISASDRALITRDVSIVFHVAATVRFDEKMKLAVPINVRSPKDALDLSREMPGLKVSDEEQMNVDLCEYCVITWWNFFSVVRSRVHSVRQLSPEHDRGEGVRSTDGTGEIDHLDGVHR